MGDVAAGNGQSPSGHHWRSITSPERGGFFGRMPVKGAPQDEELAELARLRGLTLRELPLHCFAYFSISCSQNSAVLSQLYFFRTSSGAATGWAASASRSTS